MTIQLNQLNMTDSLEIASLRFLVRCCEWVVGLGLELWSCRDTWLRTIVAGERLDTARTFGVRGAHQVQSGWHPEQSSAMIDTHEKVHHWKGMWSSAP